MSDRYSIDNRIINAAQIVQAVYDGDKGICTITLTSISGEEHASSTSDTVTLRDKWADRFWTAYQRDAYAV